MPCNNSICKAYDSLHQWIDSQPSYEWKEKENLISTKYNGRSLNTRKKYDNYPRITEKKKPMTELLYLKDSIFTRKKVVQKSISIIRII